MRDEGDFRAYVEARWATLVRTLVLLGSPQPQAVEMACGGLARCRLDWRSISTTDDIDVQVYGEVLAEHARVRGAATAAVPVKASGSTAAPQSVAMLEALTAGLERLDEHDRLAVVLHHAAGLAPDQVAEVLEVDASEVEQRIASAVAALDPEELLQRCR